jgi:hypothetical protein
MARRTFEVSPRPKATMKIEPNTMREIEFMILI